MAFLRKDPQKVMYEKLSVRIAYEDKKFISNLAKTYKSTPSTVIQTIISAMKQNTKYKDINQ
jgi:hypothetical protein